jgi:hypothetical protein
MIYPKTIDGTPIVDLFQWAKANRPNYMTTKFIEFNTPIETPKPIEVPIEVKSTKPKRTKPKRQAS